MMVLTHRRPGAVLPTEPFSAVAGLHRSRPALQPLGRITAINARDYCELCLPTGIARAFAKSQAASLCGSRSIRSARRFRGPRYAVNFKEREPITTPPAETEHVNT